MTHLVRFNRRGWLLAAAMCAVLLLLSLALAGNVCAAVGATPVGITPVDASAARAPVVPYPPGTHLRTDRPHPAVARIIVPEDNATSYGSGTLVDVRDQFGLVITNWHVVRDGHGEVEVVFPDGFRSKARALKVDEDWDLAALVIWRPPAPPVPIAPRAPQSGDQLTICGYGTGQYRAATGRCTQYYAPKENLPQHMVELDVEARQGDSGGPIFNDRGELAGVLFGAGGGTTLGSFGGRVESFLATLAPDIGRAADTALVEANASPIDQVAQPGAQLAAQPGALGEPIALSSQHPAPAAAAPTAASPVAAHEQTAAMWTAADAPRSAVVDATWEPASDSSAPSQQIVLFGGSWFETAKTVLAAVGVLAIVLQVLRVVT